ncbi:hypothetical protein XENTR_v10000915 [Xenopus tropicalis]|nr:hypothetical protein XENTR_v10000915 [Xenopus tropicalis]
MDFNVGFCWSSAINRESFYELNIEQITKWSDVFVLREFVMLFNFPSKLTFLSYLSTIIHISSISVVFPVEWTNESPFV